jgi:hypothetical protein
MEHKVHHGEDATWAKISTHPMERSSPFQIRRGIEE